MDKQPSKLVNVLWQSRRSFWLLFVAAIALCFFMLGARQIWAQEHMWAMISHTMIAKKDFFHPYLAGIPYYDKPLLSYWLMILTSYLTGGFSIFGMRIASALACFFSILITYYIGKKQVNQKTGLVAGWFLLSTYLFMLWGRAANAEMLNTLGILLPFAVYFRFRNTPNFWNYCAFFILTALACLIKGLIAASLIVLILFPEILYEKRWKKHLNLSIVLALISALFVYFFPFWLSTHFNANGYPNYGLYEVFRENIVRYFAAFDHKDPISTYFINFPLYTLPWFFLFIPALFSLKCRWQTLSSGNKWFIWTVLLIFVFLTCSSSRRNYYLLPIVPFAALMTASWVTEGSNLLKKRIAAWLIVIFASLNFLIFGILMPIAAGLGGVKPFAKIVKQRAIQIKPWNAWQVISLAGHHSAIIYLNPKNPVNFGNDDKETAIKTLKENPHALITLEKGLVNLDNLKQNYIIVQSTPLLYQRYINKDDADLIIALIPNKG